MVSQRWASSEHRGDFGNSLERLCPSLPLPTQLCEEAASLGRAPPANLRSAPAHFLPTSPVSEWLLSSWPEAKGRFPLGEPLGLYLGSCATVGIPLLESVSSCCREGKGLLEPSCQELSLGFQKKKALFWVDLQTLESRMRSTFWQLPGEKSRSLR